MPRYSYRCLDCDKEFSLFLSVGKSADSCVHCRSEKIQKQLGFMLTKKYKKTEIDDTIRVNKEKIRSNNEKVKGLTYEDIKDD